MMFVFLFVLFVFVPRPIVCPVWVWNGRNRDHGIMLPPLRIPERLRTDPITTGWFTQQLDHFNRSDTRTWKQKWLMNRIFCKPGGPGFLQFGGEGPASDGFLQTGNGTILMDWMKNAKLVNATCFILEHRYYGKSIPIKDADQNVANMQYLSSRQALADAAAFIKWATRRYNLKKWIVFGGSYSGSLSAWMRLLYPDLVVGAVSNSGPLQAIVNFTEYADVTGRDLQITDPRCYSETKKAFDQLRSMLRTKRGRDQLNKQLNLCHFITPDSPQAVSVLADSLAGPFFTTAQYGGDNRAPYDKLTLKHLCAIMTDGNKLTNPLERVLAVGRWATGSDADATRDWMCLDNSYMEQLQAMNELHSQRSWQWQCCTEFGFFQTTDGVEHPFGHLSGIRTRMEICQDAFGISPEQVRRFVDATNQFYGGQRGFNATNVVIVNGSQDPWYKLGVYNTSWQRPGQNVILVEGQAHCANMYPARSNDTDGVRQARNVVTQQILKWLDID